MHMRGHRDNVLLHGGREQQKMSGLELIDVSLEDDSLLPSTISPPEDKQLISVLRLSPPVESVPKTPGERQIPLTGCRESDSTVVTSGPNVTPEENAAVPDTGSYSLGCSSSSGPLVAKSTARPDSVQNPQHSTGNMSMKAGFSPTGARSNPWNNSKSAGGYQEMVADPPADTGAAGQESRSSQVEDHSADADKPARRQRSKRAMHSLRKSLAWDKAFSTDEGILDGDELPLFTKTPKKLPELPPLDIPEILAFVSPAAKSSAVVGTEKPVAEKPHSGTGTPSVPNLETTKKAGPLPESSETEASFASGNKNPLPSSDVKPVNATQSLSSTITSPSLKPLSAVPRPVPVTQVIEEAVEQGTKLRLPTLLVHPQTKAEKCSENALKHEVQSRHQKEAEIVCKYRKESENSVPVKLQKETQALARCRSTSSLIKPPSAATSLSKKVSSVSKRVKDTLGRVLPGSMGGRSSANRKALAETAHADRLRPATSASQSSLTGTGLKVPSSPGPSYMTRSKSARAALSVATEPYAQKSGVLAELSNKSDSKASGKNAAGQKKSKGESIWGSLRGKGGSSSTRGIENVPQSTPMPSPPSHRKTGGYENDGESSKAHNIGASHTDTSRDVPSQIAKPSGLRLPSPKIGFFDTVRTAVSHEKPAAVVPELNAKVRLPPRPPAQHGSTSARFAQPTTVDPLLAAAVRCYLSSGIPAAPHVTRASGKGARKGLIPSASAPASPCKNSEMLSPGTHQAVAGRYLTSRSKFTRVQIEASPERRKDASAPVRKLTLETSDGKIQSDVEEKATEMEISSAPVEDEVEVASTVNTLHAESPKQSADEVVESNDKVTDTAQPSTEHTVVERSNETNGEVSSEHSVGKEQLPTLNDASKGTSSGDWSVPVVTPSPGGGSENECINHLVESLHNSPSIQATFWNLQESSTPQSENAGENATGTVPHGSDSPGLESVGRQDGGSSGGTESCPEGQDRVSELQVAEVHNENSSSELASSSGRVYGRRKSIFGWQDMLAGFSPPVPDSNSTDQRTTSQQPETPLITSLKERIYSGASEKLSTPASSRVEAPRNQEPGQIMNGLIIHELRAESLTHEKGRGDKLHSSASSEEKESTYPSASRAPENENLQIKLESLFDVNWSGVAVLGSSTPGSCIAESAARSPPESKGPASAEKPHLVDSGGLSSTESPQSDAGTRSNGRSPLAANPALLNTAVDGSRLSITPPLKKERGLLAFARSAVSRLTSVASGGLSPRDENSRAIDRDGTGNGSFRKMKKQKLSTSSKPENQLQENMTHTESVSPSPEGRNVEEELLMRRGGAVQHSPPNKTQPPPNPWSPVKKGQHPGPFDCTKKVAANMLNV
ncbi:hypothetical protein R1sor_020051 [Riccia sorocarpa]|uniref:Uncharacterized protein n=1 Tax=Riccia sorocarpa TaxID=122646 RepID=A0ABD3IHK7_9MARC